MRLWFLIQSVMIPINIENAFVIQSVTINYQDFNNLFFKIYILTKIKIEVEIMNIYW